MASLSCATLFPTFHCRLKPQYPANTSSEYTIAGSFPITKPLGVSYALSSGFFKFPPNLACLLSAKSRRNCSNIGVTQVAASSQSNNSSPSVPALDIPTVHSNPNGDTLCDSNNNNNNNVQLPIPTHSNKLCFLTSDASIAIHAGERLGRGIVADAITTPVVNTSAYFFKNTSELIDVKEGRHASFEYGRYGNPTTVVLEDKISALEGAESTLVMASGMNAITVMFMALIPAGGHIVTTSDCHRKTRIFIETVLSKMGIKSTVIDPADIDALESALDENNVSLFFSESPTNPLLRCVDIELVSKLCHDKGTLVCIDGTFATPLNQKALSLGADIVLQSCTKYIAGHNDVLAGCISGPEKLIAPVRKLHNIMGGALDPNAAYLIIRGMKTLHLRIQQQNTTAMKMATLLESHPKVNCVHYPGLSSHPEHELAKRQMGGFGGVVSFEVNGDLIETTRFTDALKIPYLASSFGGCESFVVVPAIMSYWDLNQAEMLKFGIKDNLIRFSFGVEDLEDIKADMLQALDAI